MHLGLNRSPTKSNDFFSTTRPLTICSCSQWTLRTFASPHRSSPVDHTLSSDTQGSGYQHYCLNYDIDSKQLTRTFHIPSKRRSNPSIQYDNNSHLDTHVVFTMEDSIHKRREISIITNSDVHIRNITLSIRTLLTRWPLVYRRNAVHMFNRVSKIILNTLHIRTGNDYLIPRVVQLTHPASTPPS